MIKDEFPYISVCKNGIVITISKIRGNTDTLRLRVRNLVTHDAFMKVDCKEMKLSKGEINDK